MKWNNRETIETPSYILRTFQLTSETTIIQNWKRKAIGEIFYGHIHAVKTCVTD